MAYVVTENCIMCKHTDCVATCPVDCFYEGPNFLVINPDECIDCGMCEPECPIGAIKSHTDLDDGERIFEQMNMELSTVWLNINTVKAPLPDAVKFAHVSGKLELLQR
jgi:ferredoxin